MLLTNMRPTLLALHGFTLNGAEMRAGLQEIEARVAPFANVIYPDAPNDCSPDTVERLYQRLGGEPRPPPHRCWWNASDEGRIYVGWDRSLEHLRATSDMKLVLGFSQGAMAAAVLAALGYAGAVILIAGATPRAEALAPLFDRKNPIRVPSLHVWGERDQLGNGAVDLAECFDPAMRTTHIWPGPHAIPPTPQAIDAIAEFVQRHAAPASN